ncbi:hypothetical protein JGH11_13655 [Dysgonomonas sp. Marseille-P4677]|uniref:hypothetical protein n=1 Tax=Dysgonomonas sp. Marseille-P4677 TaxID=2364790 RepID=UPI001913B79F|nr:hypothetical protein [Dysgonomonas sp. Marseille-P4677]MBK5721920.1 hypothetical protein [Dysgonomonas sp. Marseille-P4677]
MKIIKQLYLTFIFMLILQTVSAQMIGAGVQIAKSEKVQFAANLHAPYYKLTGDVNFFLVGGLEYTGGRTKLSGLNIKSISPTVDFANIIFGDNADKGLFWISLDAGYLRNFYNRDYNGIVITPNVMCAYSLFYVKTGYDINISKGNNQFFVRLGLILTL